MSTIEDLRRAAALKKAALARLHQELGFQSPQALAAAILEAVDSPASGKRSVQTRAPQDAGASKSGPGRRLDAARRQAIIDALKGGVSGTEVTRKFGVSYPTVHEIKKSLGMVQARPGTGPKRKKGKK